MEQAGTPGTARHTRHSRPKVGVSMSSSAKGPLSGADRIRCRFGSDADSVQFAFHVDDFPLPDRGAAGCRGVMARETEAADESGHRLPAGREPRGPDGLQDDAAPAGLHGAVNLAHVRALAV